MEFLLRNKDIDKYLQQFDVFMKDVQDHLTEVKDMFASLQLDKDEFQAKTKEVIGYFDFSKSQH